MSEESSKPDLTDRSLAQLMNSEEEFVKEFNVAKEAKDRSGKQHASVFSLLSLFNLSLEQQKSLEETDDQLLSIIESELNYFIQRRSSGAKITFGTLGLNPDNCPGLPVETVLVRRDISIAGGDVVEGSKIVLMRGHLPVKPDKPDPRK
jgi:hypothetical protein